MSQFSPLQPMLDLKESDMTAVHLGTIPATPPIQPIPAIPTTPFVNATGQLPADAFQFPGQGPASATRITEQLNLNSSPNGRSIKIPGSRQRKRDAIVNTEELPQLSQWLSPRRRHGIVLLTIFLVFLMTLVSLTPLHNGQGSFTIFRSVSDWVHAQQVNWQFQAHQVVADIPVQNTPQPVLPPVNLPKSAYVAIAIQDANNAGISPDYFTRQINLESGFNPNAVSPSGAVGIAQFLPSTAAGLGIDPWNPSSALNGAARLMASYARNYGGDYAKALAAYNGGSGTVQYAVNSCGSNWINCLPGETRNYIRVIMGI